MIDIPNYYNIDMKQRNYLEYVLELIDRVRSQYPQIITVHIGNSDCGFLWIRGIIVDVLEKGAYTDENRDTLNDVRVTMKLLSARLKSRRPQGDTL